MERKTISEFDAVTSVDDADLMLVVQGGVYKKATALQVAGGGSTLYATVAQGAKADTALQPGDIGDTVQGYSAILDATTASFTTADETKLNGIEALADVTDTANVTAAGALMDSEVTNLAAVKAFDPTDYATAVQGALADSALQAADIGVSIQAYSAVLDATTASFTTADETKLDGIEAGADVTDTANVTAAGALMDSEVTNLAQVKAFDSTDYATAAQGTTADNAVAKAGDDMTGTLGAHDVDEDVDALSGTTPSLSVTAAQVFTLTTSGNTTLSVTNAPTGRAWARTLHLTLGGAHTFAITSADWGDDGAPDLASGDELKIQLDGIGTDFTVAVAWRKTA